MKYVMFKASNPATGEFVTYIPIIFPTLLVHSNIAEYITEALEDEHGWDIEPVSAGEVVVQARCGGRSSTLNLESRGDADNRIIDWNDYGVAMVEVKDA